MHSSSSNDGTPILNIPAIHPGEERAVDVRIIRDLVGGDDHKVGKLLEKYLVQLTMCCDYSRQWSEDLDEVSRAFHNLKSSSKMLLSLELYRCCEQMENYAKDRDKNALQATMESFLALAAVTGVEIRYLLGRTES